MHPKLKVKTWTKSIGPRAPPEDTWAQLIHLHVNRVAELIVLYGGIMFIVCRQCARDIWFSGIRGWLLSCRVKTLDRGAMDWLHHVVPGIIFNFSKFVIDALWTIMENIRRLTSVIGFILDFWITFNFGGKMSSCEFIENWQMFIKVMGSVMVSE